jgi:hypothetical protein
MDPINVSKENALPINFQRPGIPYTADVLQPLVFKHGDDYCCVLGSDPQSGVVGYGRTPEQAIQNWDQLLTDRIETGGDDDLLVVYVKDALRNQAAGGQREGNVAKIEKGKETPGIKDAASEGHKLDITVEDIPRRRNTTDQSNVDGSEYR